MNESHREPTINLNLARAYLAAHDPKMAQRTWQAVMDEMATHGIPTTQERCARGFRSKAYDPIRHNRSSRPSEPTSSQSFTPTATVSHIISADFTTWRLISVGSRGPISQNEHGQKFEAKARERSLPKNMEQSSLQRKTPSAAPTATFYARHVAPVGLARVQFTFDTATHARRRRAVTQFFDTFFNAALPRPHPVIEATARETNES